MVTRALLLAVVLVLGTVAFAPVATPALATHACGVDIPCGHPEDLCYTKLGNLLTKLGLCW